MRNWKNTFFNRVSRRYGITSESDYLQNGYKTFLKAMFDSDNGSSNNLPNVSHWDLADWILLELLLKHDISNPSLEKKSANNPNNSLTKYRNKDVNKNIEYVNGFGEKHSDRRMTRPMIKRSMDGEDILRNQCNLSHEACFYYACYLNPVSCFRKK